MRTFFSLRGAGRGFLICIVAALLWLAWAANLMLSHDTIVLSSNSNDALLFYTRNSADCLPLALPVQQP